MARDSRRSSRATGNCPRDSPCGAAAWQYLLFKPNGLIWVLFLATPLVPLFDRLFPGERFAWRGAAPAAASGVRVVRVE
jgi:hypothetical protein